MTAEGCGTAPAVTQAMARYRYGFSTTYNLRAGRDKRWELVSVLQRVPGIAPLLSTNSARPVIVRLGRSWKRGWAATRKVQTAMGPRWQLHVVQHPRSPDDLLATFSASTLRTWVRKGFLQPCYQLRMRDARGFLL